MNNENKDKKPFNELNLKIDRLTKENKKLTKQLDNCKSLSDCLISAVEKKGDAEIPIMRLKAEINSSFINNDRTIVLDNYQKVDYTIERVFNNLDYTKSNINIKIHRFTLRPRIGAFVKVYLKGGKSHIIGVIKSVGYIYSVNKDQFYLNETLFLEKSNEDINVQDCLYALDHNQNVKFID